ncbi:hypothetical protein [Deinococcus multiflagellatus]|uniref:Uncharacterized protein n=1 Tax=Deinococcus multiflagellatus TaxID=1656887 RepID=A0ABW1ZI61_9DEIO|nr:hypothetical protein [Deinococcus multiflagellatus]MBZ9713746.1 hypothetical protein [Deinococcus multiflagellatus]
MKPYEFSIAGVSFNPTVPPGAVKRSGGGREVREKVSITGRIIRTIGHVTARRVQVVSPGPEWVLSAAQIAHLRALERSGEAFEVILGPGYEVSGTFPACNLDGDARFEPQRGAGGWVNYDFTLYLG